MNPMQLIQFFQMDVVRNQFGRAFFLDNLKSLPISNYAQTMSISRYGETEVYMPELAISEPNKFKTLPTGDDCKLPALGGKLDLVKRTARIEEYGGQKEICRAQYDNTIAAQYGFNNASADVSGMQVVQFFEQQMMAGVLEAENQLLQMSTGTSANAFDLGKKYKGLFQHALTAVNALPSQRIILTQNVAITAADALEALRGLVRKQSNRLAALPTNKKRIVLSRPLYDAIMDGLTGGTFGSSVFVPQFINGSQFISFEGIPVDVDYNLAYLAKQVNFGGTCGAADLDKIYIGMLIHVDNFVVISTANEGDLFDMFYENSRDFEGVVIKTRFKVGTHWYSDELVTLAV